MIDKKLHTNNSDSERDFHFPKGEIAWNKSEKDVWNDLEKQIDQRRVITPMMRLHEYAQWVAAAVLLLLVGILGLITTYTKTIHSHAGQYVQVELPDGSKVDLNAESSITYYPLRWSFERDVVFEGEAYFTVEKGAEFIAKSRNGQTRVLGTSFTVYSRNENYRVTCLTGKVEVKSPQNETAILLPNNHAKLEEGILVVEKMFSKEKALSWKNNTFFFEGQPLNEVFDEIERQYAITIKLPPDLNTRKYNGNFPKKHSVNEVLDFVCKPMKLKFEKESDGVFVVREES